MPRFLCSLVALVLTTCPLFAADAPRLRGAMLGGKPSADDLAALRSRGANHGRYQLIWGGFPRSPADSASPAEYDRWLDGALAHLDGLLPVCDRLGLKLYLDLHTPPGGRNDRHDCRLFEQPRLQEQFVAVWQKLARRYKGKPAVVGFDLLNEAVEGRVAAGCERWPPLALRAARAIRAIDPDRTLVYEPAPWASAAAFAGLKPLPLDNVVYSFHYYLPMEFTHQGVFNRPRGVRYPGTIAGQKWDRARIRQTVEPVIAFQKAHGVPVYVGEFSAARWAPGGNEWLADVLAVWEEQGWPWAYHAFREWDGWSPEHGTDPADRRRSATPTDRDKLLRAAFRGEARP